MDPIRFSIQNPVKVSVGVLLMLLFGAISLYVIPIQLTPNVDQPIITVTTTWTGRSPEEIERDVIEEQEEKLKGVSDLRKMTAVANVGQAEIELEFFVGTDMSRAVQEVSDSLREVPEYPDEVDEPVIAIADGASESAIAWMVLTTENEDFPIASLFDAVDKRVKPFLERVSGVAEVNVFGGREREVHVQVDPAELAARGVTIDHLRDALQRENVNVSAGDLSDGRLDVRVRVVGQYDQLEQVRRTVVTRTEAGPIRVRDIATVAYALEKRRAFVRTRGKQAIAMNVIRESGSNVIEIMNDLQGRIDRVRAEILPQLAPPGMDPSELKLDYEQVYDETVYIYDALALVRSNLWIGGSLAVLVLLFFLRSVRPTLIVALAIPVSVVGTFVAMVAFGRNLNVISIAGLAFAVGMVIDNAIVVLENIDRHLHLEGEHESAAGAAHDGAREVWGAILSSTLTTVAVFVPVLTVEEEAGQLFRDISLAICAAVTLSLVVAVTVIPAAAARFLKLRPATASRAPRRGRGVALGRRASEAWAGLVYRLAAPGAGGVGLRLVLVGGVTALSLGGAWWLMPPTTYLPSGNRNLVFGAMITPPAYSIEHAETIADRVEDRLRPYWEATTLAETAKLPPARDFQSGRTMTVPPIRHFFFVARQGSVFMGAASRDKNWVKPIGPKLSEVMSSIPGAIGFARQLSIFGRGIGGTNEVAVDVKGTELSSVLAAAGAIKQALIARYGPQNVRSDPTNFDRFGPETQFRVDRVRASELGVDGASLGLAVRAMVDGAVVGEFREGGESIDLLVVRDPALGITPEEIGEVPIAWEDGPAGGWIPLGAVAEARHARAPAQIRRIEELRAVTLRVTPGETVPLQTASRRISDEVQSLRDRGVVPPEIEADFAGTADKLTQVRATLLGEWTGWNLESLRSLATSRFFIALLITYLLMAALFESFLYPLVIMFTVPLATVGGFLGLRLVHEFVPEQQLDVLTMLGFVILIGVVVNNAILIVHQALNFMRGLAASDEMPGDADTKLGPREAIRESVRTRLRPVLMTTLTSTFGMLPLVVMPGSGSELYRGLGSVVVGGLLVATFFTLLVVPLVFTLAMDFTRALGRTRV